MAYTYGRWKQVFPTRIAMDPEINIRKFARDDASFAGVELLEGPPRAAVPWYAPNSGVIRLEYPARKLQ